MTTVPHRNYERQPPKMPTPEEFSQHVQYTPGPWEHESRLNRTLPLSRDIAYAVWRGGVLIADVAGRPRSRQTEEEANARLIAAAPDLHVMLVAALAELRAMHEHYHPKCTVGCPYWAIRAGADGTLANVAEGIT